MKLRAVMLRNLAVDDRCGKGWKKRMPKTNNQPNCRQVSESSQMMPTLPELLLWFWVDIDG